MDGWPWHHNSSSNPQGYAWTPSLLSSNATSYLHSGSSPHGNTSNHPSPISSLESLPSRSSTGSGSLDFSGLANLHDDSKSLAMSLNMAGVPVSVDENSQTSFPFVHGQPESTMSRKPKLCVQSKSMTNIRNSVAKPSLVRQSHSAGVIPIKPTASNASIRNAPSNLSKQFSPSGNSPLTEASKPFVPQPSAAGDFRQAKGSASHPHGSGSSNGVAPNGKRALYKTEPCKNWQISGTCRYGSKCQFAHGNQELKEPPRHPKYKSERCRSFMMYGYCPYGLRCCFLHDESNAQKSATIKQSP